MLQYDDFDLELIQINDELSVRLISSPLGQASAIVPFDVTLERINHIQHALQIDVLRRRSDQKLRRALTNIETECQEFGALIFDQIMPQPIRERYRACEARAQEKGRGISLKLRISAPNLITIPWELLYDPDITQFVSLSPDIQIIRYLNLPRPTASTRIIGNLKILVIVANPNDHPQLEIEKELERIQVCLKELHKSEAIYYALLQAANKRGMRSALRNDEWHILHFIGHGGFDIHDDQGFIVLEDGMRSSDKLYADDFGDLISNQKSMRLVILNCCHGGQESRQDLYSGVATTLASKGIPTVIGMQMDVTDKAASAFAEGLYLSLTEGRPIELAMREARLAMKIENRGSFEWCTPVLYARTDNETLFDVSPELLTARRNSLLSFPLVQSITNNQFSDGETKNKVELTNSVQTTQPSQTTGKPCTIHFDWVTIPEGEFLLGAKELPPSNRKKTLRIKGQDSHARTNETPQRKIWLDRFQISRTPVTNAQYRDFVDSTGYRAPLHWKNGEIPIGKEDHPVVNVSWSDVQEFCKWANVRLPSEMEWEKAARGSRSRTFPWGWDPPESIHCNNDDLIGDTTPVTKYPRGASEFGVLDMAGNVSEWTGSRWMDNYRDLRKFKRLMDGKERRVIRGGAYHKSYVDARCTSREPAFESLAVHWLGFRVAFPADKVSEFEVRDRS